MFRTYGCYRHIHINRSGIVRLPLSFSVFALSEFFNILHWSDKWPQ
ncbi:hypothetical protein LEP1GSC089_2026 [Leptospira interrogans serovar Autumnalis str. LP101]|nr:hypothetical protein LEP1GSC080_0768 [Leptospira interrogans str. FPW2026]EMN54645.1 hypothetical protein LEP1GSC089_2026 [Leptospira interrogans serovar Autumnalis str. LP101]